MARVESHVASSAVVEETEVNDGAWMLAITCAPATAALVGRSYCWLLSTSVIAVCTLYQPAVFVVHKSSPQAVTYLNRNSRSSSTIQI